MPHHASCHVFSRKIQSPLSLSLENQRRKSSPSSYQNPTKSRILNGHLNVYSILLHPVGSPCFPFLGINRLMDFGDDVGVKGEVVGNSLDTEGRAYDENEMGGSSVEGDQVLDYKVIDEESPGKEIMLATETSDEPYVGQEFDSEAAAHAFYNTYATRVGFVIRVSKLSRSRRDGSAIGRALVCNKEGFRMPDKREKVVRLRAETRVGCRAMILVRKLSTGKWTVTKFVREHAHPLTPGKGRKDLVYDQYPIEHDKIRELSQQLAIEKRRSATYKRHLEMIFEHIEEQNLAVSKKIKDIVGNVREMEANEKQNQK